MDKHKLKTQEDKHLVELKTITDVPVFSNLN